MRICLQSISLLSVSLALSGCGYGYRAGVGPTWVQDEGIGATVRATIHGAPIAGGGLANPIGVGGWLTRTVDGTSLGVVITSEIMFLPGGFDPPRRETRRGLGGGALFAPLFSADGVALAGGGVVRYGRCPVVGRERWSSGGGKGGFSIRWDEVECRNLGFLAQFGRFADPDGGLPATGPWRVDGLFFFEHMWLDD